MLSMVKSGFPGLSVVPATCSRWSVTPGPSEEGLRPLGSLFVRTVSPLSLWGLLCSGSQDCCLNLPATALPQVWVGVSPSAPPRCDKQQTGWITSPNIASASAQRPRGPSPGPSPYQLASSHVAPLPPHPPSVCALTVNMPCLLPPSSPILL